MSPQERYFIKIALELGYLKTTQVASLCALNSKPDNDLPIAQLALQQKYLNLEQIAAINQKIPIFLSQQEQAHAVAETRVELPLGKIEVGTMWGDFKILAELGRGGMGVVYKAQQKSPARIVALKVIFAQKISASQRRRFLSEAQLSANLEHPNIVKVYLAAEHTGIPFLAMEYIDGIPFDQHMQQKMPVNKALAIVATVADALHYAHKRNIIHRDVKPGNILIDRAGEPHLMDFGLARSTRVEDRSLTKTGEILGTLHYMSPEQAKGTRGKCDGRTDIYALGSILYEITTGQTPVQGNAPMRMLYKIVSQTPTPAEAINPNISKPLQQIIHKAMAYNPRDRYLYAQKLAYDLRCFLKGETINVHQNMSAKRKARKTKLWLVLSAALLAVVFAFIYHRQLPQKTTSKEPAHLQSARKAYRNHQYVQALKYLHKISANHPHYHQALQLRAAILENQNKYQELRLIWPLLAETVRHKPDVLWAIGKKALAYGYFEDAHKYFQMAHRLGQDTLTSKTYLAHTFLYWGKYNQARRYYQQLAARSHQAEILLGWLTLRYYDQDVRQIDQEFNKLAKRQLPNHLHAQLLLLVACNQWDSLEKHLNQLSCLTAKSTREDRTVYASLNKISQNLQAALSFAKKNHNYLGKFIRSRIELYLQALHLEKSFRATRRKQQVIQSILNNLRQMALPTRIKIFFHEVILRFLIRAQEWQQAYKLCDQALKRFPWQANLYHLRALVGFYNNNFYAAIPDIIKANKLQTYYVLPIKNFVSLLADRLTQQEFYEIQKIISFVFMRPLPSVQKFAVQKYLKELREEYLQTNITTGSSQQPELPWTTLLKIIVHGKSSVSKQIAIKLVAEHHQNPNLHQELQIWRQQHPSAATTINELHAAIDEQKKRQQLENLRRLLLKYSVLQDSRYPLQVLALDEREILLCEILCDANETAMIRFLAAKMLMALKTVTAFERTRKIATNNKFPENLLAAIAIRETGIAASLPDISQQSWQQDLPQKLFYRILYACHVDPRRHPQTALTLIADEQELVSLCAARNFRRFFAVSAKLREAVHRRLLKLMQSDIADIRGLATQVFWHFNELAIDQSKQKRKKIIKDLYRLYWEKHGETIIVALQDPFADNNIRIIHSLFKNAPFSLRKFLREKINTNDRNLNKIRNLLKALFNQKEYRVKAWGIVGLSVIDDSGVIAEIVADQHADFYIRLLGMLGSLATLPMDNPLNVFATPKRSIYFQADSLFRPTLGRAPKTIGDIRLHQIILMCISRFTSGLGIANTTGVWPRAFGYHDPQQKRIILPRKEIQRAAFASLLWAGNKAVIKMLQNRLQEHTPADTKRALATTITGLTLKHAPRRIEEINKTFLKASMEIRQAATLGYYDDIRDVVCDIRQFLINPELFLNYDIYLKIMCFKANKRWLAALKNAALLFPSSRYYYESALLHHQFGNFAIARKKLQQALQFVETTQYFFVNQDYKRRCLLLDAQIYIADKKYLAAKKLLQQALKDAPFAGDAHFALGAIHLKLENLEQARQCFWQGYLCNPQQVLPLVQKYAIDKDSHQIVAVLKLIAQKFALTKSHLTSDVPKQIAENPWVKSLPD